MYKRYYCVLSISNKRPIKRSKIGAGEASSRLNGQKPADRAGISDRNPPDKWLFSHWLGNIAPLNLLRSLRGTRVGMAFFSAVTERPSVVRTFGSEPEWSAAAGSGTIA
jgi:hypothetical protein